jgi:PEP-CTERM motif
MRKLLAAAAATALTLGLSATVHAAVFYEPFDYPTGNLGLDVNPNGQTWYSSASSGTDDRVQVVSGNLDVAGMPASVGNSVTLGGAGRTDRIFLGTNRSSGSVYYSLMMKVSDLTGTGATGASVVGFNNTAQSAANHDTAAQPSAISGRLLVKAIDASTYQIGVSKASGTAADFEYEAVPTPLSINTDTVFVVGRYTFNPAAGDDVFDLWINPSSATFADDSLMPAPTLTTAKGADGGQIATFILRQFTAVIPAGVQYDELRVDTRWAHVTSNLVPEPGSFAMLAIAAAAATAIRRRQ